MSVPFTAPDNKLKVRRLAVLLGRKSPLGLVPCMMAVAGCLVAAKPVAPLQTTASQPSVFPFRSSGIYETGERAGWTVTLPKGSAPAKFAYTLKENNATVLRSGELDLSSGGATIEATLKRPAMLYLELGPAGAKPQTFGAAVAPMKLRPVVPKPKDFDAFWKRKLAELHAVPENPVLTPGNSYKPEVDYATIRMDHVNGTHVYGQIAKPKKTGKYPAMLVLQWASPPYPLQPAWVVEPASQGWLVLNIEPHDVLPTEPPAYYAALPDALKNYASIGQNDREKSYFVEMYQRDVRAADYLAKRPDWDGKTLVVMGTSMGGQQSLATAGLCPKVTHMIVNEPAGCDLNAALHGRQEGYPFFPVNDPKVMETARYVDAVNFAPRIRATSLVAMGFTDNIAPPAGIWTAFNEIKGRKEAAPMPDSPHNNFATPAQQRPYTARSAEWLSALVKGQKIPKKTMPGLAITREDETSRLAHLELLKKARAGGIDVYFEGDSITRRWGTSEAAYKDLLANWRENFYGWNAADFGWGGDTTANILWRLQNGELDGVNPKAIVLLAGTNDIGNGAKPDEVVEGIRAILAEFRKRAPKAMVILTAVFPRKDPPEAATTIQAVNRELAKLADGKKVQFLNVNDRLADAEGHPLEEVTVDGLHLSVRGYQIWADGLKPILQETLGPPAATDHAPMATGVPQGS